MKIKQFFYNFKIFYEIIVKSNLYYYIKYNYFKVIIKK